MKEFHCIIRVVTSMPLGVPIAGGSTQAAAFQKQVTRPLRNLKVPGGEEVFTNSYPGMVNACRKVDLAFRINDHLREFSLKADLLQKAVDGFLSNLARAVTIMAVLSFATIRALLVVPVLSALFFKAERV